MDVENDDDVDSSEDDDADDDNNEDRQCIIKHVFLLKHLKIICYSSLLNLYSLKYCCSLGFFSSKEFVPRSLLLHIIIAYYCYIFIIILTVDYILHCYYIGTQKWKSNLAQRAAEAFQRRKEQTVNWHVLAYSDGKPCVFCNF